MKHFKFKTEVKVSGRHQTIKGVAATKKQRVTASQATELINERVVTMVKERFETNREITGKCYKLYQV